MRRALTKKDPPITLPHDQVNELRQYGRALAEAFIDAREIAAVRGEVGRVREVGRLRNRGPRAGQGRWVED